ncbi:MAG: OmpA family protein [Acidobacteria bacterium]|nr:OmpA family protein [Acidobacteriota bacterium]
MTHSLRLLRLTALLAAWATAAGAQTTPAESGQQAPAESADASTRPATTTFFGDTGLWFVPTAEVVPRGKVAVSGYRRGTNYLQGFSNVGDFAGTFAIGVADRAEIFGSFLFDTRIDRDLRPLFISDAQVGGVLARYPRVASGWSGDNVGDFFVGAKINLLSQQRRNAAAVALRLMAKLPTGKEEAGVSTGKPDFSVDLVASREAGAVEVSGFGGYEVRGKADGLDAPGGAFRWGGGAAFPARSPLRGTIELHGVVPSRDSVTITGARVVGVDGSLAPLVSDVQRLTSTTAGLTWRSQGGFFVGGGVSWSLPTKSRDAFRTDGDASSFTDYADWQIRIGYHPGVRYYVPPPPPPPPPPANRPPTVAARCEPCTIEVGRTATVTADAQDPDGDTLTYRWSAPSGAFQNPADRQTVWTAPQQPGAIPLTVAVDDGRGGTATSSVTIQVTPPPPVVELTFEDVYFDFDRSTLRPEALRLLDDAVAKLQANPGRNIVIEGHTCNIGTAEYNLALGERRANSVREYLTSHGVPASRLESRSYGEERPKYDNAREETRRLNRRAALVVRVQ